MVPKLGVARGSSVKLMLQFDELLPGVVFAVEPGNGSGRPEQSLVVLDN